MTRSVLAAGVLGCCIIASQALSATAVEPKAPATVRLTGLVDAANIVDNAPTGDSAGDILAFSQELTNAAGAKVGTSSASCVRTVPGRRRECQGTFVLPRGQVFINGPEPEDVTSHPLAIVGGTRDYADVRGHVTVMHQSPVKDGLTFHFRR